MAKPSPEIKQKLHDMDIELRGMRIRNDKKRDVTVAVSSKGFYTTGIMGDIVQVIFFYC